MTRYLAIGGAILALVATGCAKQPSTTQASAPAPGGAVAGGQSGPGGARLGSGGSGGAADAGRGPAGAGSMTAGARPPVKEFREVTALEDIHFEYDRADIREVDAKVLDTNASWLKANGDQLVLIEGHCDERGTSEYNTALGDRRAKAAMNYLVSRGVPAARISVISYGEERPSCGQHTAECWAKNRRAHFLVKPR